MKTSKSIIFTLLFTIMLASCNMDKYPYDKIPLESAIESFADCQKLRTGMYRDLRIIAVSTNVLAAEIQPTDFSLFPISEINSVHCIVGKQMLRKVLSAPYGAIAM